MIRLEPRRVVPALAGAAILVGVLVFTGSEKVSERGVVPEPPGDADPQGHWIDGRPVWAARDADGRVIVLDAVNPHPWWGMPELVGWCPPAHGFQAFWDGSRFDAQGRWLFGPAPTDLRRYEVLGEAPATVRIGETASASQRSTQRDHVDAPARCALDGDPHYPEARYHPVEGSQREVFDGVVVLAPGGASFCERLASAGGQPSCGSGALHVPEADVVDDAVVLDGRLLARLDGQTLRDVIVLPHGRMTYPD